MAYRVIILGLPRSMTFWAASVLGFDHDVTAWPVKDPKPGLCDTGFALLPAAEQARYFDNETKFVYLARPPAEVLSSLMRILPDADPVRLARQVDSTAARLHNFFVGRPHLWVPSPLTPLGLCRLSAYLGRELELGCWVEALRERKDRLDDPAIRASLNLKPA